MPHALPPQNTRIERAILAALGGTPQTTEQIRRAVLEAVPMGEERAELSFKVTANVVVHVLKQAKKRGLVVEGRRRMPYANVTMQRRCPEGQPVRTWRKI